MNATRFTTISLARVSSRPTWPGSGRAAWAAISSRIRGFFTIMPADETLPFSCTLD